MDESEEDGSREQPRLTPEPVVTKGRSFVPTSNFCRTEPAQHSTGHRSDRGRIPPPDPEHSRPSAHELRTRSPFAQAPSSPPRPPAAFRRHAASGRCGRQERRVEARALEKLVPARPLLPLVTRALERPRGRRSRAMCPALCLQSCQEDLTPPA